MFILADHSYINCLFCILHIIAIFAYHFLAWYIQTMYSEVCYTACMDGKCGRDGASYTTEVKQLLYCEIIPHGSDHDPPSVSSL